MKLMNFILDLEAFIFNIFDRLGRTKPILSKSTHNLLMIDFCFWTSYFWVIG